MVQHVLLTGATGFLGSHLLEALLQKGYQVTILKRSTSNLWRITDLLEKVNTIDIDVAPLENVFKKTKIDSVIHTACSYGRKGESANEVANTNILFGLRLLDAAVLYGVDIFLNSDTFFNTGSSSPKYLSSYSLSKKQFVEWLQQASSSINVANLKLQHMYGPKDEISKFIPWVISELENDTKRIPLTEGSQLRDFIYVGDVVSAYLVVLEKKDLLEGYTQFDVGTGSLLSVKEFVRKLHSEFRKTRQDNNTTLGFGDVPQQAGEVMPDVIDNSTLQQLGWWPALSIEQGILLTLSNDVDKN